MTTNQTVQFWKGRKMEVSYLVISWYLGNTGQLSSWLDKNLDKTPMLIYHSIRRMSSDQWLGLFSRIAKATQYIEDQTQLMILVTTGQPLTPCWHSLRIHQDVLSLLGWSELLRLKDRTRCHHYSHEQQTHPLIFVSFISNMKVWRNRYNHYIKEKFANDYHL